jgi:hypothetical protein
VGVSGKSVNIVRRIAGVGSIKKAAPPFGGCEEQVDQPLNTTVVEFHLEFRRWWPDERLGAVLSPVCQH